MAGVEAPSTTVTGDPPRVEPVAAASVHGTPEAMCKLKTRGALAAVHCDRAGEPTAENRTTRAMRLMMRDRHVEGALRVNTRADLRTLLETRLQNAPPGSRLQRALERHGNDRGRFLEALTDRMWRLRQRGEGDEHAVPLETDERHIARSIRREDGPAAAAVLGRVFATTALARLRAENPNATPGQLRSLLARAVDDAGRGVPGYRDGSAASSEYVQSSSIYNEDGSVYAEGEPVVEQPIATALNYTTDTYQPQDNRIGGRRGVAGSQMLREDGNFVRTANADDHNRRFHLNLRRSANALGLPPELGIGFRRPLV